MPTSILLYDTPKTCWDCRFLSESLEVPLDYNLYKKVRRCTLSRNLEVEDPWRDPEWFMKYKEEWCPLRDVPKKFYIPSAEDVLYACGWNACIDKILGGPVL